MTCTAPIGKRILIGRYNNKHDKFVQQLLFRRNHRKAAEKAAVTARFRAKSEYARSKRAKYLLMFHNEFCSGISEIMKEAFISY